MLEVLADTQYHVFSSIVIFLSFIYVYVQLFGKKADSSKAVVQVTFFVILVLIIGIYLEKRANTSIITRLYLVSGHVHSYFFAVALVRFAANLKILSLPGC